MASCGHPVIALAESGSREDRGAIAERRGSDNGVPVLKLNGSGSGGGCDLRGECDWLAHRNR